MGPDTMILVFWMLSFKPIFSLSSFTFIKRLFSSYFAFCHKGDVICMSEVIDISPCPACVSSSSVFLMPSGLKFMSGEQESQITVTLFFIDMVGHIPFHTTCEMTEKKKKKETNNSPCLRFVILGDICKNKMVFLLCFLTPCISYP